MALVGSVTGVMRGVVEQPIDIVQSIGRELVSRAEENGPEDFVAGLPNNAQRISLPMISESLPYQPSKYPTSVEAAHRSAHARNSTHDLASPKFRDVQEDVGNAALNKKHLSKLQTHPSKISQSHLSTSSIKSLTLTTV